jgi:AraC-like DNA-binding protein
MPERPTLTPEEQAAMRVALLALLARLGLQPHIDPLTGDLHVDLEELCHALGCSEEDLARIFRKGELATGSLDSKVPLQ